MTATSIRPRHVGLALSATLGLFAAIALSPGPALAQAKPAKACPKDFMASCLAACAKAGGQARLCPAYCERRKRETGCP
jgi:hypothetical protein